MFNLFRKKKIEENSETACCTNCKQEPTVIYCRIKELQRRVMLLKGESFVKNVFEGIVSQYAFVKFNTKLGERNFYIRHSVHMETDIRAYTDYDVSKEFSYIISMYDGDNEIFEVVVSENETKVRPALGCDSLTAKDIDLAIYELEQFIEPYYQSYEGRKREHLEEVKKLERGI